MPETEPTTFESCLRRHLATRLRGPRRFRAASKADNGFVAEVLEGHHIALRQATSDIRRELQEVIDGLTADYDALRQRFGDLQAETQRMNRAHDQVVAGFRADLAKSNEQLETSEREASELRRELARAQARLVTEGERDTSLADLGELLTVTGLGDHARAEPPHEVFQEALAAVRQMRHDLGTAQRALAATLAVRPEPAPRTPAESPSAAPASARERLRAPVAGGGKGDAAAKHPGAAKP